jgi:hydrogenase maturation protease
VTDLLVIGYGNDLRSDDGAGRAVAAAIAERNMPGVEVRSVSQLTPELSLEIAGRSMVVFVDADVDATELQRSPVHAGSGGDGVMTHHGDPSKLLSLTENVGPAPAEALAISIPATNLEMGFEFSPATAKGVEQAVDLIVELARR